MAIRNLKDLLAEAQKHKYAVGAFNAVDSHFARAVLMAAAERKSPVILNIAEVHFDYCPPEIMIPLYRAIAEPLDIPIAINLDHGVSHQGIMRAIKSGFTSIMFDGSDLTYRQNIEKTKNVVEMCHPLGVSVEAELGAVGGEEGGGLVGAADRSLYTNPNQAAEFVELTGIDALAVAIGNSHGLYKGEPNLDFALLKEINDKVSCPLVLHGGSGITGGGFRKAISLGISKINFYTGMSQVALGVLKEGMNKTGNAYNDYPLLMLKVEEKVQDAIIEQIDLYGSSGKANS